jgi:hypothetical protein
VHRSSDTAPTDLEVVTFTIVVQLVAARLIGEHESLAHRVTPCERHSARMLIARYASARSLRLPHLLPREQVGPRKQNALPFDVYVVTFWYGHWVTKRGGKWAHVVPITRAPCARTLDPYKSILLPSSVVGRSRLVLGGVVEVKRLASSAATRGVVVRRSRQRIVMRSQAQESNAAFKVGKA